MSRSVGKASKESRPTAPSAATVSPVDMRSFSSPDGDLLVRITAPGPSPVRQLKKQAGP